MTKEKTCYNCGNKNCHIFYSTVKQDVEEHHETYEYRNFDCVNHDEWEELKVDMVQTMTREEIFRKNFPQYVTEKGVCLSPFWDLFNTGIEVATFELAKNYQTSRLYLEGYEDAKKELEKENAELKSIADFQTSSNMDRYFQLKRSKEQLT